MRVQIIGLFSMLCGLLVSSMAFAETPSELHDKFVKATKHMAQVVTSEMDLKVEKPRWDAIEGAFADVEVAFNALKDAGINAHVYKRNGTLVVLGAGITGSLLFYRGLYKGGSSFAIEKTTEKALGSISVVVGKSESRFVSVKPAFAAASGVVIVGGVAYYLYARSKSKALDAAIEKEVKESDDLYRAVCTTYKAIGMVRAQENSSKSVSLSELYPSLTKACASGRLNAAAL